MTTTMMTGLLPVRGVPDGKGSSDPLVRQAWLDKRRSGVTSTEVRDAGIPSKRRAIITAKVTGVDEDQSNLPVPGREHTLGFYAEHGNRREPVLAAWIESKYGISPCSDVYEHPENRRWLASPDGISRDPFTGDLIVGTPDARLAEIKTSVKDLNPGRVLDGILVEIDPNSEFAKKNYNAQMQWAMFVMQASACLFVWEQHDDKVDPETGTFSPLGPPQAVWIMRDQELIDVLVEKVAEPLLKEIDAARLLAATGELPPVSDLPAEHAILVADYLKALDMEKVAAAAKEAAWNKLKDLYVGEGREDKSVDLGFAKFTVSTSSRIVQKFDEESARKRAPKLVAQYEALKKRYTKPTPVTSQKLTITASKKGTTE